jgi:hypothetical protein
VNRSSFIWIAAVSVVVAAVIVGTLGYGVFERKAGPRPVAVDNSTELEELRARLNALENRPALVERTLIKQEGSNEQAEGSLEADTAEAENGDSDDPANAVPPAEAARIQRQAFDNAVAAQAYDAAWAPATERMLAAALAGGSFAGSRFDGDVVCRTSMCSAKLVHDDFKAQMDFLSGFPRATLDLPHGAYLKQIDESGQLRTVVFFAKDDSLARAQE